MTETDDKRWRSADAGRQDMQRMATRNGAFVHAPHSEAPSWDRAWLFPALQVSRIPGLLDQLIDKGSRSASAALIFNSPLVPPGQDPVVNLQFSLMRGVPGFDWLLHSIRNIADEPQVRAFMQRLGHRVCERSGGRMRLLRVEDGDLAALAVELCLAVYRLSPESELSLVEEGFRYVPDAASLVREWDRSVRYYLFEQHLPAWQADRYSVPEVWTDEGWQPYAGDAPWDACAHEISREAFQLVCRHCRVVER